MKTLWLYQTVLIVCILILGGCKSEVVLDQVDTRSLANILSDHPEVLETSEAVINGTEYRISRAIIPPAKDYQYISFSQPIDLTTLSDFAGIRLYLRSDQYPVSFRVSLIPTEAEISYGDTYDFYSDITLESGQWQLFEFPFSEFYGNFAQLDYEVNRFPLSKVKTCLLTIDLVEVNPDPLIYEIGPLMAYRNVPKYTFFRR